MTKPIPDFLEIIKILSKHKVDFIVVGGVCGVLHGAPVTTFDIDIVHSLSPPNQNRLFSALHELEAYYRGRGNQQLSPELSNLSSPGHHLLMTKFGPLDILGTIGNGHDYNDLVKNTVAFEIEDTELLALDLKTLIEVKTETISEKDKIVLPILRRTLEEKQKQQFL